MDILRNILRLKDEYKVSARKFLEDITFQSGVCDQLTIVSVHVRRGDYKTFIKQIGKKLVTKEFFTKAMHYARQNYENVLFIVISDDIDWCRRNLGDSKNNDVYFSTSSSLSSETAVGLDLGLMMSSDVSILSHGTFGQWGALLSRKQGDIIIPSGHPIEILKSDKIFNRDIKIL